MVIWAHYMLVGPCQLLIVVYVTYGKIGAATLAGVALVFFFIPVQGTKCYKTKAFLSFNY